MIVITDKMNFGSNLNFAFETIFSALENNCSY